MCIKATRRFSRASSCLPKEISTKLPQVIAYIEKHHPRDACRIRQGKFWRTRVTRRYRLFYRYDELGCLCLLDFRRRDKHTYRNTILLSEEYIISIIETEKSGDSKENLLSRDKLYQCNIPDRYHQPLLEIQDEDGLLLSEVPYRYLKKIIDILDRSIEAVNTEFQQDFNSSESLVDFCLSAESYKLLHPLSEKQNRILELPNDRAILVQGGPGTGKSILALHRIKKLLSDRKRRKILFTTHSETLVEYFKELLEELVPDELDSGRVEVRTVDDIVREYARESQAVIASREISELCLNSVMRMMNSDLNIARNIQAKLEHIGELLILQEILGKIESMGISSLEEYRQHSTIGTNSDSRANRMRIREAIWYIYEKWENLLQQSGYITIEQSRRKALNAVIEESIRNSLNPDRSHFNTKYDAVIVDEVQDLSPTALKLLIKLGESSRLFLTADRSQSLYERHFSVDYAQRNIEGGITERTLTKSFRNTREIGIACPNILIRTDRTTTPFDFYSLEGNKPKIFLTDDLIEQSRSVVDFIRDACQKWKLPVSAGVILVPNELLGLFITRQLNHIGLKAQWLDRKFSQPDEEGCIQILSLHAAKGREFEFVAIVGLEEDILPRSLSEFEEHEQITLENQERRLFYVGCSRAMRSLLVCGSRSKPSKFINEIRNQNSNYWEVE